MLNAGAVQTPWAVAIFASRETVNGLAECAQSVSDACQHANVAATIDILVNGNPELAHSAGAMAHGLVNNIRVRVWNISMGDKAHAWNEYIHRIWPSADSTFFVDGYAKVNLDSLKLLQTGLIDAPHCLAATAVPCEGRSGKQVRATMLAVGGLQGSLHAIGKDAMLQFRSTSFRLPVGLYRTDSLIGAVMMYRFSPGRNKWDPQLIRVQGQASWTTIGRKHGVWNRVTGTWKRKQRQAQGILENLAVRQHLAIRRDSPETLPNHARQLVIDWVDANPGEFTRVVMRNPLVLLAERKLRQSIQGNDKTSMTTEMDAGTRA